MANAPPAMRTADDVFNVIDKNHDGVISRQEFKNAVSLLTPVTLASPQAPVTLASPQTATVVQNTTTAWARNSMPTRPKESRGGQSVGSVGRVPTPSLPPNRTITVIQQPQPSLSWTSEEPKVTILKQPSLSRTTEEQKVTLVKDRELKAHVDSSIATQLGMERTMLPKERDKWEQATNALVRERSQLEEVTNAKVEKTKVELELIANAKLQESTHHQSKQFEEIQQLVDAKLEQVKTGWEEATHAMESKQLEAFQQTTDAKLEQAKAEWHITSNLMHSKKLEQLQQSTNTQMAQVKAELQSQQKELLHTTQQQCKQLEQSTKAQLVQAKAEMVGSTRTLQAQLEELQQTTQQHSKQLEELKQMINTKFEEVKTECVLSTIATQSKNSDDTHQSIDAKLEKARTEAQFVATAMQTQQMQQAQQMINMKVEQVQQAANVRAEQAWVEWQQTTNAKIDQVRDEWQQNALAAQSKQTEQLRSEWQQAAQALQMKLTSMIGSVSSMCETRWRNLEMESLEQQKIVQQFKMGDENSAHTSTTNLSESLLAAQQEICNQQLEQVQQRENLFGRLQSLSDQCMDLQREIDQIQNERQRELMYLEEFKNASASKHVELLNRLEEDRNTNNRRHLELGNSLDEHRNSSKTRHEHLLRVFDEDRKTFHAQHDNLVRTQEDCSNMYNFRHEELFRSFEELRKVSCQERSTDPSKEFVRNHDHAVLESRLALLATREELRQVEERIRQSAVSVESHHNMELRLQSYVPLETQRSLEQRLESFGLQAQIQHDLAERMQLSTREAIQKLEQKMQSLAPVEVHHNTQDPTGALQKLEERLELLVPLETHQRLESRLCNYAPLETHRKLEARLEGFATLVGLQNLEAHLQSRLQNCTPFEEYRNLQQKTGDVEERILELANSHNITHAMVRELQAQMSLTLGNHAKIQDDFQKMADLERISLQAAVDTECSTRLRGLQELRRMVESFRDESAARVEKLGQRIDEEGAEWKIKFYQQQTSIQELISTHERLKDMHRDLNESHMRLSSKFDENFKPHSGTREEIESLLQSERAARVSDLQVYEARCNAELTNVHNALKHVEESIIADQVGRENKHRQLGSEFDVRYQEIYHHIQEHRSIWESRLSTLEPRVDTNTFHLQSLKEELKTELSGLRTQVQDTESLLERQIHTIAGEAHSLYQQHVASLKEEIAQQVLSIRELHTQLKFDTSKIFSQWDSLKEELSSELMTAHNELERVISERHMASAAATSDQMNELVGLMKADSERGLREAHERIEELHLAFLTEQNNQVTSMAETLKSHCFFQIRDKLTEERGNIRKMQEELLRLVEAERDARLKQATELKSDLVKAVTKEHEERVLDSSEQRTEMTKTMREWHLAQGVHPQVTRTIHSLGAEIVSPAGPSYLSSLLIGPHDQTVLRSA